MLTKEKVMEAIGKFPSEFSLDELVDRMILLEKIGIGLEQSEKGEVVSEEELDEKMKKWFK